MKRREFTIDPETGLLAGSWITAGAAQTSLTVFSDDAITASTDSRTLSGLAIRYGAYGRTSAGRLRVRPGGLEWASPLSAVKLIREHDLAAARGFLTTRTESAEGVRITAKVADGPEGDAALSEANPAQPIRAGLSFHVVDPVVEGDELVAGKVIAIGQVGIPAYDETVIDQVAASLTHNTGEKMTEEQRARLAALRAQDNLTAEETAELSSLAAQAYLEDVPADGTPAPEPAPAPATAGLVPAVPAGVPAPAPAGRVQVIEEPPLDRFYRQITAALSGERGASITAALNDIADSEHSSNVSPYQWLGELWSGLVYQRQFVPLLGSGPLTSRTGTGWRWVVKPEVGDYAGNKAAIPSNEPTTEDAGWVAARLAGGHDIDRSFYDFKDEAFIRSYIEAMRESYALKSDLKALAYIQAAATVPVGVASQTNLLKAAAIAGVYAKRATNGQPPTAFLVNDLDLLELFDMTDDDRPAYLSLWGIDPEKFVSSDRVAAGAVTAVVKQAATFRELPGSPIRVSAQHIANGGIDEALFGYWAVEEHHAGAFVEVPYDATP